MARHSLRMLDTQRPCCTAASHMPKFCMHAACDTLTLLVYGLLTSTLKWQNSAKRDDTGFHTVKVLPLVFAGTGPDGGMNGPC